ncbi:MAG: MFS transporter [Myxococcales bacterium]|nr:MFS transporter [Myxococcales bacterium]
MINDLRGFAHLLGARRDFRRLWVANMVSMLGDWLSYVAVSLVAVNRGESAVTVGLVLVAHSLPMALLSPIAGPLADRFDRRRLMIVSQIIAGLLTVGMFGAVHGEALGWMQVCLLLRVAVSGLGLTARFAAVPQLVEPGELHTANALLGLTWSVLFTAGVALGGVLSALMGPGDAILCDAATFAIAALIIARLPALPPPPPEEAADPAAPKDFRQAWRYARARPRLLAAVLAKSPSAVVDAAGWVTLNLVAGPRLAGSTALGIGVMHALRAIGTGVGPLLPRSWIPREANLATPLAFVGVTLFLAFDTPWVFLPALVVWGMGTGHNWVSSTSEMQAMTPGALLGRMTALNLMTLTIAQSLLAIGAGFVIDEVGSPASGGWVGLGLAVIGWAALMVVRSRGDRPGLSGGAAAG